MHILIQWRKICKVSKRSVQNCKRSCAHKRYSLSIYWGWKMTKFTMWKKWQNVLTIIPKSHAHPQTMKKTHAKFQNNEYKTVRGVALTRGTHCLYLEVKKWLSSQCAKSDKKKSNNYIQTTCTSSYHVENVRKISKWSVQNCRRSCAHKTSRVNVDGKTNGRTDGNLHV